jgi:hypothetical protein
LQAQNRHNRVPRNRSVAKEPVMTVEIDESPLYVSYMLYAATGEGLTVAIAVAGGAHYAATVLKEKIPSYFHPAIVTAPFNPAMTLQGTAQPLRELVPNEYLQHLRKAPSGAGHYFSEFHFNLS